MGLAHRVPHAAGEEASRRGYDPETSGSRPDRPEALVRPGRRSGPRGALHKGARGERGQERARHAVVGQASRAPRGLDIRSRVLVQGDEDQPALPRRMVQLRLRPAQGGSRGGSPRRLRPVHAGRPGEWAGLEQRSRVEHQETKVCRRARRAPRGGEAGGDVVADVGEPRDGERQDRQVPAERPGAREGDGPDRRRQASRGDAVHAGGAVQGGAIR